MFFLFFLSVNNRGKRPGPAMSDAYPSTYMRQYNIQTLCMPTYMAGYTSGDRRQIRGKEGAERRRGRERMKFVTIFSYYLGMY